MGAAVSAAASSAPCTAFARTDGYERRRPEETLLYQLVEKHWPVFREKADESGGLPRFVVRDFEEYLRCGLLEHGCVELACRRCGHPMLVAFSCKRRGFCPSCLGRRMSDLAAHLVDDVLPEVPIRQWVCSLLWSLPYVLAYDRTLCAEVLDAFLGALTRSLRRRAKRELGLRSVEDARAGAITFVQRCDGSLRINPHFHSLALDGVYVRREDGALVFHPLSEPSAEEVAQVAAWTHATIARVLERHGRSLEGASDAPDPMADEQPVLASCYGASAADVQLLGASPGEKTSKLVHPGRVVPSPAQALAEVGGVNVHAKVVVDGRDRKRLERLCRYVARPPLAQERLEVLGRTVDARREEREHAVSARRLSARVRAGRGEGRATPAPRRARSAEYPGGEGAFGPGAPRATSPRGRRSRSARTARSATRDPRSDRRWSHRAFRSRAARRGAPTTRTSRPCTQRRSPAT
jgi:hypothetical protein